ncbi:hypothetical protein [Solimonas sp. SE-A11]|uniref:hypothetical protein n=1 Tax=Solimonas sp. SE-A11 TaxID=3054954 RepID=UPI00259CE8F1|nr:hypothetical protein [Solimonas sp. SE-A11]MDM4768651.1 hypothetical protein [Solimonas sp. SE-A11]
MNKSTVPLLSQDAAQDAAALLEDDRARGSSAFAPFETTEALRAIADGRAMVMSTSDRFVPGEMHCAKCRFSLTRTNLYLGSGTVGPGDSKTEPCPNGCGPLWPVTWEQSAREAWKRCEDLHQHLQEAQASATRYTWLRSRDLETITRGGVFAGLTPDNVILNGVTLDDAIDKASAANLPPPSLQSVLLRFSEELRKYWEEPAEHCTDPACDECRDNRAAMALAAAIDVAAGWGRA